MDKVSVLIPSRNEQFLQRTIDDLFAKAEEEIEIIVVLDGYWPDPPLMDRPNLIVIHRGEAQGMRPAINSASQIATGKYLLKCDAHCIFGQGFDRILKADCDKNWLVVPSRYTINVEKWERQKSPVNYEYLTFPYLPTMYGPGLHGKAWKREGRDEFLVDDDMSFQGSGWFMHRSEFMRIIHPLDHANYYFYQESTEIGMKVWLSGGRVVINKKTWYAHLHKGKEMGRGFYLSLSKKRQSEAYGCDYWMNNHWPGQVRQFKWLIEHFWPVPSWPEDWENLKYKFDFEHRTPEQIPEHT